MLPRWLVYFNLILVLAACVDTDVQPRRRHRLQSDDSLPTLEVSDEEIPVEALTIKAKEIPLVVKTRGRTEPAEKFEYKVEEKTFILAVLVQEGQQVSQGETLLRLDDEIIKQKLALARAELREAEAALDEYQQAQGTTPTLLSPNSLFTENNEAIDATNEGAKEENGPGEEAPKEPEEKKSEDNDLEAEDSEIADMISDKKSAHAEAKAERAKTEIAVLEKLSEKTTVTSPINGTVMNKQVQDGSTAEPGQVLLEVVRLDPLRVIFLVDQADISAVEQAEQVQVRFPHLTEQTFGAELVTVGIQIEGESQRLGVKAQIPNEGLALKPGMDVDVTVLTKARRKMIPVPPEAIHSTEKSHFVFLIKDGNELERVPVSVADEPFEGKTVIQKGVKESDVIVLKSSAKLVDGMRVKIMSGNP